jgi:hypothetical protein
LSWWAALKLEPSMGAGVAGELGLGSWAGNRMLWASREQ